MVNTDWTAIALAALRAEYPRLPTVLPDAVAALVPVIVERMEQSQPGVTSQMVGAYSVVFAEGGRSAPITALEAMVLRPYARSKVRSVRTPSGIARERTLAPSLSEAQMDWWAAHPEQADVDGVFDTEGDL